MITAEEIRKNMNHAGRERMPFVFVVDFELTQGFFLRAPFHHRDLYFDFQGFCSATFPAPSAAVTPEFSAFPMPMSDYEQAFQRAQAAFSQGDSFLLNLTLKTPIETNLSLEEIFLRSHAPYRLYYKDHFVCFSPETFVQINPQGEIRCCPMKGTINAQLPHAKERLLNNAKELAEHYTIVDLVRNDLSQVAKHVCVRQFRYVETIQTLKGALLQTSSEVVGQLPDNYADNLGDLLWQLLPAGSISGAPKPQTLRIIRQAEKQSRGFYTGVAGYFDGELLSSAVLIRFIEQENGKLFFRSGGGLTINSQMPVEYEEVIEKIYLPFA